MRSARVETDEARPPGPGPAWKSAERAKVTMNVFPVCRRCVHEDDGSPGFWVEKFREVTRPHLES